MRKTAERGSAVMTETYDFMGTVNLPASMVVSEYVGNGHSVPRRLKAGVRVTITYYYSAFNCGIRVHRQDGTVIGRDFVATPAVVLAATGIDVKA
jgi:hypothetical protein